MTRIQLGDILIAKNGDYYRVVECKDSMVSLMRINGYTLFSCSERFVESMFGSATSSAIA